jgi:predicted methyltransferase
MNSRPDTAPRAVRGPLVTLDVHDELLRARKHGKTSVECSLDLGRSRATVFVHADDWEFDGERYPYLERCKERTIYFWEGAAFRPVARYADGLIKLVQLIEPRGKTILDTCGGLGYFAAWCLREGARAVRSYEKNPNVLWLRSLNPWSPETGEADARLTLEIADIAQRIGDLESRSFDAALHDPPRFGIAGELYSQAFYDELARVLRRGGRLFHYTGTPNKLTSGRDVPNEVAVRLRRAGFTTELRLDGVLATKQG